MQQSPGNRGFQIHGFLTLQWKFPERRAVMSGTNLLRRKSMVNYENNCWKDAEVSIEKGLY